MKLAFAYKVQDVLCAVFRRLKDEVTSNNRDGRSKRNTDLEWRILLERNGILDKGLAHRPPDSPAHVIILDPGWPRFLVVPLETATKIATLETLP